MKFLENKTVSLTAERKKQLLRSMLLLRHFELTVRERFFEGKIPGFCHIYVGEEATAVGICETLNRTDYIVSTHRGHGHCLAKGADPKKLMSELYGKKTGYCRGRGGSMHIFAKEIGILGTTGIVGSGLPIGIGAGMHIKLRKTGQVSVCFFGDGAANQGTFHESVNIAAMQKLPVIFACENNLYATATRVDEVTLTRDFANRARAYGIPGKVVDGNNVLEVYENALEAVERARAGQGPTILECKTYRHFGHYVGEDTKYRSQQEVDTWLKRDPIKLFKQCLLDQGVLDAAAIDRMEREVKGEIEDAERFATESPLPEPDEVL